jgi:iron complex outermembrane receptor protein
VAARRATCARRGPRHRRRLNLRAAAGNRFYWLRWIRELLAEKDQKSEKKKKEEGLTEIVVTGSRIPLTAGQRQVQPVRSYTREDIERSGQTTMGEFLNTLPDVSTATGSFQTGYAGMQTVQLHGLPIGTTVNLLNGRRLETSSTGFFDLSNIPVSAVERVEILPVGASAIYGADALAGAVNFILRKDFSGFEVNATLDQAPGVHDPALSVAWGKRWERGSASLITSYESHGELLGAQREPTSLTNVPESFPVVALGGDSCAPGNVYSVDGNNLPGLASSHAGIPAGVLGVPTIAQFAPTAGKQNVCNLGRYSDITSRSHREGVLLSAKYQFTESGELFTEVLFSHKTVQSQGGPLISVFSSFGGAVAASNPYNPFGQDVNVSFSYPGSGLPADSSSSFVRPIVGVRGSIFSDWHYEATATLSRDHFHDLYTYSDFAAISNALASSDPTTALNPFTSGAPGTPQLLESFQHAQDVVFDNKLISGQGVLRGPLLILPAGKLQTVVGIEVGKENQDFTASGLSPSVLRRSTYATFGEARVPLLARGRDPQRGERLTLTLAGRYDHSTDYGGKATFQGGMQWRATDTLSLNASHGQSYQAPLLAQISGPQNTSTGPLFVVDPFRGNETALYNTTIVNGPNYNLRPETGASSSLQVAYATDGQKGLRASLTWYDLKISNYIGLPQPQVLVDNPNLFPGAVVRAPATPQDEQQGFLGQITQFTSTYYNFGDIHVDGVDADISYMIDSHLGEFTPSLAIANIYKWQAALTPGAPVIDGVDKATIFSVGWSPRWKGTASLAWKRGPLSANVAGRYIGRYLDYQLFVPNTNEVGNTWIFDVSARAEVGQSLAGRAPWLTGAYVALGAVNVLNKIPPLSFSSNWFDQQQYDIRGRFLHFSIGARF